MTTGMIFQTTFEFFAVAAVIWGIFNERKLVDFEDRVKAYFRRRRMRVSKNEIYRNEHIA